MTLHRHLELVGVIVHEVGVQSWRKMMINHIGTELWYLLNMFNGMGYMILFVVAMIWVRMLLQVVEVAVVSLRMHPHDFIHPTPGSLELKTFGQPRKPTQSVGSEMYRREKLCINGIRSKPESPTEILCQNSLHSGLQTNAKRCN
jgi:hypothetical protein